MTEYYFDVTADQGSVVAESIDEAMDKIKSVIANGVGFEIYDTEEVLGGKCDNGICDNTEDQYSTYCVSCGEESVIKELVK